jgi:hypothetical protein
VAQGKDNRYSDIDLIMVAREGGRDALWEARDEIAARILGGEPAWSYELPWQRPYRFQAFRPDLLMADLTFDEGSVTAWQGLRKDVAIVIDRDGVAERMNADLRHLQLSSFDAPAFDQVVWPWLLWLEGRIRHGACWYVRSAIHELLNGRVIPLLVAAPYHAEQDLPADDMAALTSAAPRSSEPRELRRALADSVELYSHALDRWAERTGSERPRHPLAPAIRDRIATQRDD